MTSQHSRPIWVGLLASVICPTLFLSGAAYFSADRAMIRPELVVLVSSTFTFLATFVVALPYVLWLRRSAKLTALRVCFAGAVVGALGLGAFNFYSHYYPEMNDRSLALSAALDAAVGTLAAGAMLGLLSAGALCLGAGIPVRPSREE